MKTQYLRQFPGKRRYERVSKEDWEAVLPHKDVAGFGHVLRLEADVRVWAPDGELQLARKWPSRSYVRNFARIVRNIFGQTVQLFDRTGALRTTAMNTAPGVTGQGLIPELFLQNGASAGSALNPELAGAGMAIGNGFVSESNQANDLTTRIGGIYSARSSVRTSVESAATTTLEITQGITNRATGALSVNEIGLFLFFCNQAFSTRSQVPYATLLAYDGITPTPVALGGVIAPRYTMDFPV